MSARRVSSAPEMYRYMLLILPLLAILVQPISSTCTDGGNCPETRDMDLEEDERVADRYLRRTNELLARFSKDQKADERSESSMVDLGYQIRLLESAQREGSGDHVEHKRLQRETRRQVEDLCTELDIQGPPAIWCQDNTSPFYRTHDASCNNLQNPAWGKAVFPLRRNLSANYDDGVSSFCGPNDLPSAREVSVAVTGNDEVFNPIEPTQLVMHFGQFVDHDLVHIPTEEADCDGCAVSEVCCPIGVPDDDPLFSSLECLPFKRSRPTLAPDCVPGVRHLENQITSYLDSSNVYGSNDEEAEELRDHTQGTGQMNVNEEPIDQGHLPVLPPDETNTECTVGADLNLCGKGGDFRAAEQPGLTGLHTILVREHNRIANELHELNSQWDDERLFQEARKIVNAIYQHITYNEFLPILLGMELMDQYSLSVGVHWPYGGYDDTLDATITNGFATAAFRLGHSFVPESLKRVDSKYRETVYPDIPLHEAFFNATYVHDFDNGGIDAILLGMIDRKLLQIDRHFSESVTSFLFADEGASFGMDLVSLNIQRGRDHGLPSYAEFFRHCNGNDLTPDLPNTNGESATRLLNVYGGQIQDIDAFIGMVTENPAPGAVMGPTAGCVIAAQFQALKFGDRFWYENQSGLQAFTLDQLNEIRKASYARLLCDNLARDRGTTKVQPYAFMMPRPMGPGSGRSVYKSFVEFSRNEKYPGPLGELPNFDNKRTPCTQIPEINLDPWRE